MISSSIRVVPEYQRLVVFRLGRAFEKAMGPGMVFLLPSLDRAVKVDLREQKREIPQATGTTKDYESVSFAFRWSYKMIDPFKSVLSVANFQAASTGVAATGLRELAHETRRADLSFERERIPSGVSARLDETTKGWGMKVMRLEITRLVQPIIKKNMEDVALSVGTMGETQSAMHTSGIVLIGNQSWDAISNRPIIPKTRVRVRREVLEVEEDSFK